MGGRNGLLEDVKVAVAGGEGQRGPAFVVQRRLDVDILAVQELVVQGSARATACSCYVAF